MNEPMLRPIKAFADSRGFSFFNIFGEPTSGQINIGNLHSGIVKAFHYHKKQWDHWFCISGDIHVVCFDPIISLMSDITAEDLPQLNKYIRHFYIGEHNPSLLSIPPEWSHGYTNVGNNISTLLYWVTKKYDATDPDEYRLPWNIFGADFWLPENK